MPRPIPRVTIVLMAVLTALVLAACRKNEPVRIGFVGGLTGRSGDLGTAGRDGALLAVDVINASGGINGRRIELIVRDDQSNSEEAKRIAREMVNSHAVAVVGPMTSAMAEAAIPLSNAAKLLMLSPTAASYDFNAKDDYFLHLNLNNDTATATADRLVSGLGIKSCALVYDTANHAYTRSSAEAFKRELAARGGVVTSEQTFNSKDPGSLLELTKTVLARKPGSIFIIAGAVDSAMICQQLKKIGSTVPVFVAEWAGSCAFLKTGGNSVSNVFIFQHFNSDSRSPAFSDFKNSFTRRFGDEPDYAATYSYEAVAIIAEALKKNPDPSQLKQTIIGIGQFKGLQGSIALDRFGDPQRPFSMMQVRNGRFALVE